MSKRKPVKAVRTEKRRSAQGRPASPIKARSAQVKPQKAKPAAVLAEGHKKSAVTAFQPNVVRPAAEAVALFEQAMTALQKKDYQRSLGLFQQLLDRFSTERTLLDRARVYLELCRREIGRQQVAPKTIEERLMGATLALNDRDDREAERLARSVLADAADHDLARYLLAVVAARRNQFEEVLTHLQAAVRVNPEVRVQARLDDDFAAMRSIESFQALIEPSPAPFAQRRGRRTRNDR